MGAGLFQWRAAADPRSRPGLTAGPSGDARLTDSAIQVVKLFPLDPSKKPYHTVVLTVDKAILHAVFFGLPLSLMYAATERRMQHVGRRAHAVA